MHLHAFASILMHLHNLKKEEKKEKKVYKEKNIKRR